MDKKLMQDRFRGTLVGLAVGDALGGPVEFLKAQEIIERFGTLKEMIGGGEFNLKPGAYTDDTDMMLCIAESLVQNKGYKPDDIARRFVDWLKTGPKDIGHTVRGALERIDKGVSWEESGDKVRPSNGSVMRCAPIGLVFFNDFTRLIQASIGTSYITHAHNDAALSCVILNTMISELVQGTGKNEVLKILSGWIRYLKSYKEATFEAIYAVADPASGLAVDTLVFAFLCFTTSNSFEEAVVKAVNLGGDADTIGAVTGALAGSYWGISAIPERWSSKLNPYSSQKISGLADGIFELAMKHTKQRRY